jgi:glutathione peroxidase
MALSDVPLTRLDGTSTTFGDITDGRAALVVNVASRCGLTPQYAGLQTLHEKYADRGFTVVGVPCNQFGGQEPGSSEEIAAFCSADYGVTFPMTEKVEVNGPGRHPLYDALAPVADENGDAGDITWNFEKFLVDAGGRVVARFSPSVVPDDPRLVDTLEALLVAD